nr:unnamed protein product [Callosobruchus analis]
MQRIYKYYFFLDFSGYLRVSNLKLAGIHNIAVSNISTSGIGKTKANMTIGVSDIHLDFGYDTDITLLELLPVYGAGLNHFLLQNLKLELNTVMQVNILPPGIHFDQLNATMAMQALLVSEGLSYNVFIYVHKIFREDFQTSYEGLHQANRSS